MIDRFGPRGGLATTVHTACLKDRHNLHRSVSVGVVLSAGWGANCRGRWRPQNCPGGVVNSDTDGGGHAVVIVGWDDGQGPWPIKNAWGDDRGPEHGCVKEQVLRNQPIPKELRPPRPGDIDGQLPFASDVTSSPVIPDAMLASRSGICRNSGHRGPGQSRPGSRAGARLPG